MVNGKCAVCSWVVCHTARPRPGSSVENTLSLSVVFDNILRDHVVCQGWSVVQQHIAGSCGMSRLESAGFALGWCGYTWQKQFF